MIKTPETDHAIRESNGHCTLIDLKNAIKKIK
jgi:hypothetical protein